MYKRKKANVVVSVLLAFVMIAGSFQIAIAQRVDDNHIEHGRQGIFIPGGFVEGFVRVEKIHPNNAPWAPVRFVRPLMHVTTNPAALQGDQTAGQSRSIIPTFMTYVFYNISTAERRQWDQGRLNIYYLDRTTDSWQRCNTFLVASKNVPEDNNSTDNRTQGGRLACVAPQLSTYGLAVARTSD